MNYQVPISTIIAMICTLTAAVGVPVVTCIIAKVRFKTRASLLSVAVGAAIFVLFAMTLERLLHGIVFSVAGNVIQNNIWLYAIYGGLAAGVFEETGRYVGMKFLMKRDLGKENAVMYGIGHGGIESIMLVGMAYVSNLVVAFTINGGGLPQVLGNLGEAEKEAVLAGIAPLWELPSAQFAMAGVERMCAFALQIALSYLVYTAVRYKKKTNYILAVVLHAVVNAVTVLLAQVLPVYAVMFILLVMVAVIAVYVVRLYRKEALQGED